VIGHCLKNGIGALLGAPEVASRRELGRGAHKARQHGRLTQRKLLGALAEVAFCGGVDAVSAGAEEGGVQIADENLVLAELALQPERQHRLLNLPLQRPLL
jgi:hypothetical protein